MRQSKPRSGCGVREHIACLFVVWNAAISSRTHNLFQHGLLPDVENIIHERLGWASICLTPLLKEHVMTAEGALLLRGKGDVWGSARSTRVAHSRGHFCPEPSPLACVNVVSILPNKNRLHYLFVVRVLRCWGTSVRVDEKPSQ